MPVIQAMAGFTFEVLRVSRRLFESIVVGDNCELSMVDVCGGFCNFQTNTPVSNTVDQ